MRSFAPTFARPSIRVAIAAIEPSSIIRETASGIEVTLVLFSGGGIE
jgi:hypothetical protein